MRITFINPFLFCIILLITQTTTAQCPPGEVVLSSQAQVDSFLIDYPSCTLISGNLFIGKKNAFTDPNTNISDLTPLANITEVNGLLNIVGNDPLTSLNGLGNIDLAEQLTIQDNASLTDLSQLSQLDLDGPFPNLTIWTNAVLTNLIGLEGITNANNVSIEDNPLLNSLGLTSLNTVTTIGLRNLPALLSLNGIGTFTAINDLRIINCDALTNVVGLPPTLLLNGSLSIVDNQNLSSLLGFNFGTVKGVFITDNPSLTTIGTLTVTSNLFSGFRIENNPLLASIDNLLGMTGVSFAFSIADNPLLTSLDFPNIVSIIQININRNNGLTTISGFNNLTSIQAGININDNPMLTSVIGFNNLSTVFNLTFFNNTSLQTVQLDGIQTVTDRITFRGNSALNNLSLTNLMTVGSNCEFTNSQLTNFNGLSSLSSINGLLVINTHSNLASFSGLSSLQSIRGISIVNNPLLSDLTGMTALNTNNGRLLIRNNPNLMDLTGLPTVTPTSEISISTNAGLKNLTGLEYLTIAPKLSISNNANLETLEGLEQLLEVTGSLAIAGNGMLDDCTGICNLLENGTIGSISQIALNLTGCNTLAEITTSCSPPMCQFSTDTTFVDITIPCNSKLESPKITDMCIDSMICGVPLDSSFYFKQGSYATQWKFTTDDGTMDTVLQNITVDGVAICDTASTGIGSLRNALACAEDGDTIDVLANVMNDTLILEGIGLIVNTDVILSVDPGDNITIDASGVMSAFTIESGHTLTLDGISLIVGSAVDGGAAINNGTLNIINSMIFPHPQSPGGSQFSGSGEITIDPVTVIHP